MHREKSTDYGSDRDALSNYVATSRAVSQPAEFSCWLRIHEKTIRALNMLQSGRYNECEEGIDVASLAIAAEALRRRRS